MFSREQITKSVVQSTSRKIISCLIRRKIRAFIAKCNSLTQTLQANWKCWVCVTAPSAPDLFIFKLVSVTLKPWLRARWMLLSKCNYQLYFDENPCRKKSQVSPFHAELDWNTVGQLCSSCASCSERPVTSGRTQQWRGKVENFSVLVLYGSFRAQAALH